MTTIRIPPLSTLKMPEGQILANGARPRPVPPRPMPMQTAPANPIPAQSAPTRPAPTPQPKAPAAAEPAERSDMALEAPASPMAKKRTAQWLGGALLVLGLCGGGIAWQILKADSPPAAMAAQPVAQPAQRSQTPPPPAPAVPVPAVVTTTPEPSASLFSQPPADSLSPAPELAPAELPMRSWDLLLQGQ